MPLNPPQLVTDRETDMAIQLFMQATILLSNVYGYPTIRYSEVQDRSARAGFKTLPFMPPTTVRATPELLDFQNRFGDGTELTDFLIKKYGYKPLVKYYIKTGLRASQIVCRNYLLDLDERNQYLEFLQKEFGVVYALASGILAAVNANATLAKAFLISRVGIDEGINVYQEYRFLNIDRDAARVVIETAQNKLADFYLQQVDSASNDVVGGYTFSDALNAVSIIEYQCTRSGVRALLNKSINNTPTNLEVDRLTGTIIFKSALIGEPTPPTVPAPPSPKRTSSQPSVPKSDPADVAATATCPPLSATAAPDDEDKIKLKSYLLSGPGTLRQRQQQLQNLLDRPNVKRLLVPDRDRPIAIVVEAAGCEAVRKELVAVAKQVGLVN